jgi:hypothetical protein
MNLLTLLRCLFRGHDYMYHFDEDRLRFRCTECGRKTHGWVQDRPEPRRRFEGDPNRFRMKRDA